MASNPCLLTLKPTFLTLEQPFSQYGQDHHSHHSRLCWWYMQQLPGPSPHPHNPLARGWPRNIPGQSAPWGCDTHPSLQPTELDQGPPISWCPDVSCLLSLCVLLAGMGLREQAHWGGASHSPRAGVLPLILGQGAQTWGEVLLQGLPSPPDSPHLLLLPAP